MIQTNYVHSPSSPPATGGSSTGGFPPSSRAGAALVVRIFLLLALVAAASAQGQELPPYNYYGSTSNMTGTALKSVLHDIIKDHTVVPYTRTVFALTVLDQDPQNIANLILIYSGVSVASNTYGNGSTKWNREHLWPQSYGVMTGKTSTALSDLNNLRPCNSSANSSRGSKYFDVSMSPVTYPPSAPGSSYDTDSWEPRDADKGPIARSLFYMAVRYDGSDPSVPDLELGDTPNAATFIFGKLSSLLGWNRRFPPTDSERTRNGIISGSYQHNRNPFIDNPDFADMVFLGVDGFTAWQNTHFQQSELTNATISSAEADPDSDGMPNLAEYAFGHDPHVAETDPIDSFTMQTDGGTNRLYITHDRNHFASGIVIGYETCTDLTSWAETVPEPVSASQIDPQRDSVTVRFPVSTEAIFIRFKIHWPLP